MQCNATQCNACNAMQRNATQCNNAIHCNAMQCNQCNQCNTLEMPRTFLVPQDIKVENTQCCTKSNSAHLSKALISVQYKSISFDYTVRRSITLTDKTWRAITIVFSPMLRLFIRFCCALLCSRRHQSLTRWHDQISGIAQSPRKRGACGRNRTSS